MKTKSLKKKLIALIGCAAIAGTAFAAVACGGDDNTASADSGLSVKEFYGIGAVSTVKLLGGGISAPTLNAAAMTGSSSADATLEDVKLQAEDFNKYFNALDIFTDDATSISTEANTDEAYAGYATKMTVKGKDISGSDTTYVMYYNETLANTAADEDDDIDDEDDDKNDKDDKDDGETESTYTLDGKMISGGTEYLLSGLRSVESEKDEHEEELKIRAYVESDPTSYVEMEQEVSTETGEHEIEYVYRVYQNGVLSEETAVEFETEQKNNKTETEFELEFRKDGKKSRYSVVREEKSGKSEIKVKYNMNGESGMFKIEELDEGGVKTYKYTFTDNTVKVFDAD